jgi:hypothetical protein
MIPMMMTMTTTRARRSPRAARPTLDALEPRISLSDGGTTGGISPYAAAGVLAGGVVGILPPAQLANPTDPVDVPTQG